VTRHKTSLLGFYSIMTRQTACQIHCNPLHHHQNQSRCMPHFKIKIKIRHLRKLAGMLILVFVLVLKDSLRTFFKSLSLSWSLGVRSLSWSLGVRSLSLSWSLGVRSLSWSLGVRSLLTSLERHVRDHRRLHICDGTRR